MLETYRSMFVDGDRRDGSVWLVVVLALVGFVGTLAAYAVGRFEVSGGIVWVPYHAAVVGLAGGCLVGALRGGVLAAWVVAYAPFLGYNADHVFYGLSGRTLREQVAIFLEVDGLAALGLEAVVVGSIGFLVGRAARSAVSAVREAASRSAAGDGH